jgi:hypothetical protein
LARKGVADGVPGSANNLMVDSSQDKNPIEEGSSRERQAYP